MDARQCLLSKKTHQLIFSSGSVNTNLVTIRKLVREFKDAKLVHTIPGSTGGTVLAKSPQDISLKHVYDIFRDETLFGLYPDTPNPQCLVGRILQFVLLAIFEDAETLLSTFLEKITLVEIRDTLMKRAKEVS